VVAHVTFPHAWEGCNASKALKHSDICTYIHIACAHTTRYDAVRKHHLRTWVINPNSRQTHLRERGGRREMERWGGGERGGVGNERKRRVGRGFDSRSGERWVRDSSPAVSNVTSRRKSSSSEQFSPVRRSRRCPGRGQASCEPYKEMPPPPRQHHNESGQWSVFLCLMYRENRRALC
jgi:hypothetical protein